MSHPGHIKTSISTWLDQSNIHFYLFIYNITTELSNVCIFCGKYRLKHVKWNLKVLF